MPHAPPLRRRCWRSRRAARADSSIDATDRYAWGANIGWIDWRADGTNGAVFSRQFASGWLWSANIGWIHLGDGSPANGTAYSNTSGLDYGVNATPSGGLLFLSGYAWSPNAGWISFENTGTASRPLVAVATGILSGYVYGANVGWIPLFGSGVTLRTDPALIADPATPTPTATPTASVTASPSPSPLPSATPTVTPTSTPIPAPDVVRTLLGQIVATWGADTNADGVADAADVIAAP